MFGFILLLMVSCVSATWWNSSWNNCIQINLSNSFPFNFTHNITLNSSSINYSNFRVDGEDLRFLEGTCNNPTGNLLSKWVSVWNSSGNSFVWVKTNTANAPSLAMYYNFATATNTSNMSATYWYFDDFDDNDVTDWVQSRCGGSADMLYTAQNGIMNMTSNGFANNDYIFKNTSMPSTGNFTVGLDFKTNGTGSDAVIVDLPFTPSGTVEGCGSEVAVVGFSVAVTSHSATQIRLKKYDWTYPGGNGHQISISLTYRV